MIKNEIELHGNILKVTNARPSQEWIAAMMTIPLRSAESVYRVWSIPLTPVSLDMVLAICKTFEIGPALWESLKPERRLSIERQRRDHIAAAAALKRIDLEAELPNGYHLLKHQKEAIPLMIAQRRVILADDMGLGKTITSLIVANAWGLPIYVIAPAQLRLNWQDEAAAVNVPILFHSWNKIPPPPDSDFVIILDEAHYAQNLKSARTKAALELTDSINCRAVYPMSGTPIKNGRPSNLYPILKMIRHWIAADKYGYDRTFCDAHKEVFRVKLKSGKYKTVETWNTDGAKNLDKLHAALKGSIIRRTKAECLDLPPKTRVLQLVEMTGAIEAVYEAELKRLKGLYLENIKAKADGNAESELFVLQLISAFRQAGSMAKSPEAIAIAQELIEQGQGVVLFTAFKETAERIAAALGCFAYTGDKKQDDRRAEVLKMQSGTTKAMVCTFGAGGVGINLFAAQNVILVDRVWTPGDAVQAEDRVWRNGQKKPVSVRWLQVDETDQQIDKLLLHKQGRIELVLKGKRKTFDGTAGVGELGKAVAEMVFA